ncbi:hypothetical protein DXV76_12550 [Rhodobacteraceae bacterium CCMM004]|nr:hypothetical protein DXV76_12550 [Rhodobacteraceae bacterium CCMM004]
MRPILVAAAVAAFPLAALAVGSDDSTPPKPTQTNTDCTGAQVWDEKTQSCVDARDSRLDDATRLDAVRELAHAGALDRAGAVLDAIADQSGDGALTYRGFLARQTGDMDAAMLWYARALDSNPDNLLARSYMGQGLAAMGDMAGARAQLTEIRTRGGRFTWPEVALRLAIESGRAPAY